MLVKFGFDLSNEVGKDFGKEGVLGEARVSLGKVESNWGGEPMRRAEGAGLHMGHEEVWVGSDFVVRCLPGRDTGDRSSD